MNVFWLEMSLHHGGESIGPGGRAACKEIQKAGIMLWIRVETGVALCEEKARRLAKMPSGSYPAGAV